jgi:hypothetical protein
VLRSFISQSDAPAHAQSRIKNDASGKGTWTCSLYDWIVFEEGDGTKVTKEGMVKRFVAVAKVCVRDGEGRRICGRGEDRRSGGYVNGNFGGLGRWFDVGSYREQGYVGRSDIHLSSRDSKSSTASLIEVAVVGFSRVEVELPRYAACVPHWELLLQRTFQSAP